MIFSKLCCNDRTRDFVITLLTTLCSVGEKLQQFVWKTAKFKYEEKNDLLLVSNYLF